VDGNKIDEPYVRYPATGTFLLDRWSRVLSMWWATIGSMPIEDHLFGQTSIKRIVGVLYGENGIPGANA
jgi:hypothetical protein